jgi:hypothetical protein
LTNIPANRSKTRQATPENGDAGLTGLFMTAPQISALASCELIATVICR